MNYIQYPEELRCRSCLEGLNHYTTWTGCVAYTHCPKCGVSFENRGNMTTMRKLIEEKDPRLKEQTATFTYYTVEGE